MSREDPLGIFQHGLCQQTRKPCVLVRKLDTRKNPNSVEFGSVLQSLAALASWTFEVIARVQLAELTAQL